ncbi:MAG: hypothetical protein JWN63_701 [Candidatus Acidoferrum typicum]|jgi:hypothetical protein|nr:hypothetical protein [Candidatus Acidoferrum typicum]
MIHPGQSAALLVYFFDRDSNFASNKRGAMLAHRTPKKLLCFSLRHSWLAGFHQSRVTSHSYFFGRDSGGTIPLFR